MVYKGMVYKGQNVSSAMRFVFPALFESHLGSPSFHLKLAIPLTRKDSQSPQVTLSGTPGFNVFVSTSFRLCHVFNLKRSEKLS